MAMDTTASTTSSFILLITTTLLLFLLPSQGFDEWSLECGQMARLTQFFDRFLALKASNEEEKQKFRDHEVSRIYDMSNDLLNRLSRDTKEKLCQKTKNKLSDDELLKYLENPAAYTRDFPTAKRLADFTGEHVAEERELHFARDAFEYLAIMYKFIYQSPVEEDSTNWSTRLFGLSRTYLSNARCILWYIINTKGYEVNSELYQKVENLKFPGGNDTSTRNLIEYAMCWELEKAVLSYKDDFKQLVHVDLSNKTYFMWQNQDDAVVQYLL